MTGQVLNGNGGVLGEGSLGGTLRNRAMSGEICHRIPGSKFFIFLGPRTLSHFWFTLR